VALRDVRRWGGGKFFLWVHAPRMVTSGPTGRSDSVTVRSETRDNGGECLVRIKVSH
jgi:hypothetical protein